MGLCVVHLVWVPLGPQPLARFLESYRRHDPGVAHRLLILFNGARPDEDLAPWRRLLAGVEHEELHLERPLIDLAAYRLTAERLPADRYCFLNSYSEPLVAGWLAKLDTALAPPSVGLVGATGSWASTRSWMAHVLRLPSAYAGVLPDRGAAIEQLMTIENERSGPEAAPPRALVLARARLRTIRETPKQTLPFERFPAYHIRTNAFMISRATLTELRLRDISEKHDAYLLENGRSSITRQVQRNGLRTLVVDRRGDLYDHTAWHHSRTFWQGDQEGLLVADNQTRRYGDGDAERRRVLSSFAWGPQADPTIPSSPRSSDLY